MPHDRFFPPENIDEQVERAGATSRHELPSLEGRMLQRLSDLYTEDKRSTERVEQRLAQQLARRHASGYPAPTMLTSAPAARAERKCAMSTVTPLPGRRAASRFALIAATLLVSLLVGSLLMVFNLARSSHTSRQANGHVAPPATTAGIYFNRANEVYRLDTRTREVVWQTHLVHQPRYNVGQPTVIGDAVYISAGNSVTALDARTGKLRWSHLFSQGPIVLFEDSGQLYANPIFSGSALYAVNPANGSITATYTPIQGQKQWGTPTVVNGVLYYQYNDSIYALQLPGETFLWRAIAFNQKQLFTGFTIQEGVIYAQMQQMVGGSSSNKGLIEAFNIHDGSKIWQSPTLASPIRTVTVTHSLIYVASVEEGLMAFDTHTHNLVWQKPYNTSRMLEVSGILYLDYMHGQHNVIEAFAALDVASGQLLWQKENDRNGGGGGAITIGVSGGVFYGIGWTDDGQKGSIYALNASSGTPRWIMPTSASYTQWGGITVVE